MNIVLTYDPRWEYRSDNIAPFWASMDTVDYIAGLLEDIGIGVLLVSADDDLEFNLRVISKAHPGSLVFWLNEFRSSKSGVDVFTVRDVEKVGMMHTGPSVETLEIGLNKESTKKIFRRLGLRTPQSIVANLGDCLAIYQCLNWNSNVIIKPLLQGHSMGIDKGSVIYSGYPIKIKQKVEAIHRQFNEPAIVERYIGGDDAREYSLPVLISHDGIFFNLPIIGIDFSKIPPVNGNLRYLTQGFKQEKRATCKNIIEKDYLQIPAELPEDITREIISDVGNILFTMGCRDMARVDIRADGSNWQYIEVNTNPGKNKFSYFMMSAYSLGLDYEAIIAWIPYQAMLRYGLTPPLGLKMLVQPVSALFDHGKVLERDYRNL
jgi:D-alanine-D-alanine ligase